MQADVNLILDPRELEVSDFNRDNNRAVWFDIPVVDLDRASKFYAAVLGIKVEQQAFGDIKFAVLEHADGNGG